MRLTFSPLLALAAAVAVVLGFDLVAAVAARLLHVPYITFMIPDLALFAVMGFVLARRLSSLGQTCFYVGLAALVEATAGRALATALAAEVPPPGTSAGMLVLETFAVSVFTMFWAAIGIAIAYMLPHRR